MSGTGINNHFGWVKQRSAWQDIEYHRQKRAEYAAQDQANMDAMNTAMSTALQNKISQSSNLSANAALKRVQDAAKAKIDETTKQLDDAQSLVDQTSQAASANSTTTTSSTSSVLDTVA
jgi:hypothetical protein